jgi:uncharacterized protein (DUF4415 family)
MNRIPKPVGKEISKLAALAETNIDLSDIPETTVEQWAGAVRGKFYRPIKQQVTVRIDADVLEWLKAQGKGHISRVNSILRAAMLNSKRS